MPARKLSLTAELVPQDNGGFAVWCPELDIYTQGETEKEGLKNLREAALLHLQELGTKKPALSHVRRRTIRLTLP